MKVHFFDKAGNFLKTDEMEESRIRFRFAVPDRIQPLEVQLERDLETVEPAIMMKYRVFGAIPIHPGDGSPGPLFYLYLEVPQ